MARSRVMLCIAYAGAAMLALVGTWHQNVTYFRPSDGWLTGFVLATLRFWPETFATPASTSITIDLGLLLLPLCALMIIEARRLGVRFVWLYIVLGLFVAISVTFPLFLIARERRLAARGEQAGPGLLKVDVYGMLALTLVLGGVTLWTLGRR